MNPEGYWVPSNCSESHFPVCQKHRYGQGIYPGEDTSNLVDPGLWKVQIQTKTGGCSAQVRSQSEVQVFYGFTQDAHNDFPELYANSGSNSNYLVANAVGLAPYHSDKNPSLEGRLNYAILGYDKNFTNPLVIQDRRFVY
uniref:MD domain-containing protein n=1 Tax=Heterorhabditis bacteriophora TaxID=37862 RepID=A0A1I7XCH1_HETBA